MREVFLKMSIFFMTGMSLASCSHAPVASGSDVLRGKVICLDPGHGGTAQSDRYRVGRAGEREEWIDLRVALQLRQMLEKRGARVLMTRTEDVDVPLEERASLAVSQHADVFISIHHNATADPDVNFPVVYFHGNASENQAGVALARSVAHHLSRNLFGGKGMAVVCSDLVIFPGWGTAVLRNSYGIPGVIGEASFFTNPSEEARLKQSDYNQLESRAYLMALEDFFSSPMLAIHEKYSIVKLPPFTVLQEAERTRPEAQSWMRDFIEGSELARKDDVASQKRAYDLLTRSASSFPDSYVAGNCHRLRAEILSKWGMNEEAIAEKRRAEEHYPMLD